MPWQWRGVAMGGTVAMGLVAMGDTVAMGLVAKGLPGRGTTRGWLLGGMQVLGRPGCQGGCGC